MTSARKRSPGLIFSYRPRYRSKSILRVECVKILVYNYYMQMRINPIKEENTLEIC